MNWSEILGFKQKCLHNRVPLDAEIYYCPDCGELIENQWFITSCDCCNTKETATIRNGEIVPLENFCRNCGNKGYKIERISKIDCININYAVLVRVVIKNEIDEYTQSWIEAMQTSIGTQKLLR